MKIGRQAGDELAETGEMTRVGDRRAPARLSLNPGDIQFYRLCEDLSEPLIYAMLLFTPWAFGTTQPWSVWTMNGAGYLLGAMWGYKVFVRRLKGYRPPRWDHRTRRAGEQHSGNWQARMAARLTSILAVLTGLILAYCLVSALNAQATYNPEQLGFNYHKYVAWLPHSLDSQGSWTAFWNYLALAFSFWAIHDWLLGKAAAEQGGERSSSGGGASGGLPMPARLRRLLWVLSINGGLLAVEGIVQRLAGTGKLLFLVMPQIHQTADTQFGPYAYRANGAQYLNLVWPVSLGFWWTLHRAIGWRRHLHHILLVCAALMAACPLISTSRGGALITVGIGVLGTIVLLATHFLLAAGKHESKRTRRLTASALVLFLATALTLGFALGWKALKPRFEQIGEGFDYREQMYENARPMAADYPLFGTGPGSFTTVFGLYRISTETYWPTQLHNDWLETRITFGALGSALIGLAFLTVMARWFLRGGIHGGRRFVILTWLALAGCMVHARYDFPFQVYSILFVFLVHCAMLFSLSRRL